MTFVGHAHVHRDYSPLDGTGTCNQLTHQAVKIGQTHIGCTDHGRLGGVLEHIDCCRHPEKYDDPDDPGQKRGKDERLIPWVGIEAFWRPDRFMDLSDKEKYGKQGHNWKQHLCFHASDLQGWYTLLRLSSKSWVRRERGGGFYGAPCFDWDMIENDHEGIIVSTACLASPISQLLLKGYYEEAKQWSLDMIDIVGEKNVFFEIMPHNLDLQREINLGIINIANELGRPFMTTGDVHTPYAEWMLTQQIVRMAAYGTTVSQQDRKKDAGEEIYTEQIDSIFLSSENDLLEMYAKYHPDIPTSEVKESLSATEEFARRFRMYTIGKTTKLPKVTDSPLEAKAIIREWCEEGLQKIKKAKDKIYKGRFDYEFKVLRDKGVLDYFVMVGDMVRWAKSTEPLPATKDDPNPPKKRPIRVGLGRGSAAGSLVSYLIGITAIDPVAWRLLFERFLNPDRVGLPDIDLDFETELKDFVRKVRNYLDNGTYEIIDEWVDGREYMKEYLKRTYGHDHVADIIAYQTFAPRAVIDKVLSTQDFPYTYIKSITDTIGDTERGLEKIAKDNEKVAKLKKEQPKWWQIMLNLEDQILRDSRHAGGVLVTDKPVTRYVPTQLGNDEVSIVTAWADRAEFPIISDYGLVKLDVLGVKSLAKQELACHFIRDYYEEEFEPNDLPVLQDPYDTDQDVIDLFVRGQTLGLFQFAGRGITQLLRHIRPDNAIDIAVANALYRPGPIKEAFKYGDRKNGLVPESEWYWHESVEPILKETLGIVAFQESIMEITKVIGKFTGGQADSMRKAISKLYRLPGDKAREFMQGFKEQWHNGCDQSGLREEDAEVIWNAILEFSGYGFNKSHSASYSLQSYQDGHIKLHYPLAFYASELTITKKSKKDEQIDHLRSAMREARIFDVEILPPDINNSDRGWSIDNGKIRYGLVSISGVGGAAAVEVIKHRPYKSLKHFLKKVPTTFNVSYTEALAHAGSFDAVEERPEILRRVRQWPITTRKFKIEMECGCKKTRTVKLTDNMLKKAEMDDEKAAEIIAEGDEAIHEVMEDLTDWALEDVSCSKHDDNPYIKHWEEIDPYYSLIAWYKDHPGEKDIPQGIRLFPNQILELEEKALNIPLSQANLVGRYADFIDERIYTEEEFDALPAKPKKKGKKHGMYCDCKDCDAAHCVIGGEIINVKKIITKKGQQEMAFIDVAHGVNQWSVTMFAWVYKKFKHQLHKPTAFLFAGHKDDRGSFLVYDMQDVLEVAEAEGYTPPQNERHRNGKKKRRRVRRKVAA